jgi:hypothetical protein
MKKRNSLWTWFLTGELGARLLRLSSTRAAMAMYGQIRKSEISSAPNRVTLRKPRLGRKSRGSRSQGRRLT